MQLSLAPPPAGNRLHSFFDASLRAPNPTMLIVPDTLADSRFQGSQFVKAGPQVRFYAGAPLVRRPELVCEAARVGAGGWGLGWAGWLRGREGQTWRPAARGGAVVPLPKVQRVLAASLPASLPAGV